MSSTYTIQTRSRPIPVRGGSPGASSPSLRHTQSSVLGGCPPPAPKMGSMEVPSRLATTLPSLQLPGPITKMQPTSISLSSSMEFSRASMSNTRCGDSSVLSVLESQEFQQQLTRSTTTTNYHQGDIDDSHDDIVRYQQGSHRSTHKACRVPSIDDHLFTLDS